MTDSEATPPAAVMSETYQSEELNRPEKKTNNISFSIWPPSQRTRDAVTNRLVETLSTPSVLSKRYGTMTSEEATAAAKLIEEEAFAAAGGSGGTAADLDDGIEVLQLYSKEISKRMLETVKARAGENGASLSSVVDPDTADTGEEVSPVKTESA